MTRLYRFRNTFNKTEARRGLAKIKLRALAHDMNMKQPTVGAEVNESYYTSSTERKKYYIYEQPYVYSIIQGGRIQMRDREKENSAVCSYPHVELKIN